MIERHLRSARDGDPPAFTPPDELVDVAYAAVDSPVGPLLIAGTDRGLVRLAFDPTDEILDELAARISPRVLESPAALDEVRRELDEYFAGRRNRFEVRVDRRLMSPGFTRRVLAQTSRIPYGAVSTYGEMARRAGSPRAARAAGNALGSNPVAIVVPCHRVLHASGGLGGYGGGLDRKSYLLSLEGARTS